MLVPRAPVCSGGLSLSSRVQPALPAPSMHPVWAHPHPPALSLHPLAPCLLPDRTHLLLDCTHLLPANSQTTPSLLQACAQPPPTCTHLLPVCAQPARWASCKTLLTEGKPLGCHSWQSKQWDREGLQRTRTGLPSRSVESCRGARPQGNNLQHDDCSA